MPGVTLDDQEAVRRMKSGDIGGLEVLVHRYQVRAVRAAFLVTQDEPLAEDVVQDAFSTSISAFISSTTLAPSNRT